MPVTLSYPKIVEFEDGTQFELPEDTWEKRLLMIETDRTEEEVRRIFYSEQFTVAGLTEEIVKVNQLGAGLIKKNGIWQMHVRLFPHGNHIAIDAEAELASDYGIEHLTHGWIPAFKEAWNIIVKHFQTLRVYHKSFGKYIINVIKEETITLKDPETKTEVITIVCIVLLVVSVGVLGVALSKK